MLINGRRLSEHEAEIKKWEEKIKEREKMLEAKEDELKKKEKELLEGAEKAEKQDKETLESLEQRLEKLRQRERELTEQEEEELTKQREKISEIQSMKAACINERLKIEAVQEQIANDEVPNHDSAFSSRETTASPPPNRVILFMTSLFVLIFLFDDVIAIKNQNSDVIIKKTLLKCQWSLCLKDVSQVFLIFV